MTFEEWWIHHKPGRPEIKPHEIVQLPSYRSVAEDAYDAGVSHAMARYEETVVKRLAAAEKVIEAARNPAMQLDEEFSIYPELNSALSAYDKLKETDNGPT